MEDDDDDDKLSDISIQFGDLDDFDLDDDENNL